MDPRPPRRSSDMPLGGRELIEAMRQQYQQAMRVAERQRVALEQAGATASDDTVELTVSAEGRLTALAFTERAEGASPLQLSSAIMRVHRAAVRASAERLADNFPAHPDIVQAMRDRVPPPDDSDGQRPVRTEVEPDDAAHEGDDEEYPLPPKGPVLERWSALRQKAGNPIAALNAIMADPTLNAARPQGDPQRWNQDFRDEISSIVTRGRELMPQLRALEASASSEMAEVTVTMSGVPSQIRVTKPLNEQNRGEVAGEILRLIDEAHGAVEAEAQALIRGTRFENTPDVGSEDL